MARKIAPAAMMAVATTAHGGILMDFSSSLSK